MKIEFRMLQCAGYRYLIIYHVVTFTNKNPNISGPRKGYGVHMAKKDARSQLRNNPIMEPSCLKQRNRILDPRAPAKALTRTELSVLMVRFLLLKPEVRGQEYRFKDQNIRIRRLNSFQGKNFPGHSVAEPGTSRCPTMFLSGM